MAALGGQRGGDLEISPIGAEEAKKMTGITGRMPSRSEVLETMRAIGMNGKPIIHLAPISLVLGGSSSLRKSSWPNMRYTEVIPCSNAPEMREPNTVKSMPGKTSLPAALSTALTLSTT